MWCATSVHHDEAARAVGGLDLPRLKASLTKECCVLVPEYTGYTHALQGPGTGHTVDLAGAADLGRGRGGQAACRLELESKLRLE